MVVDLGGRRITGGIVEELEVLRKETDSDNDTALKLSAAFFYRLTAAQAFSNRVPARSVEPWSFVDLAPNTTPQATIQCGAILCLYSDYQRSDTATSIAA